MTDADIRMQAEAIVSLGMKGEVEKQNDAIKGLRLMLKTEGGAEVPCSGGLSFALRALCLTRDYVGEKTLPAIEGWEWHDAGVAICKLIPDDPWAAQFRKRIKR